MAALKDKAGFENGWFIEPEILFNPIVAQAYNFLAWPFINIIWPTIEKELQGATGQLLEIGSGTGLVTERLIKLPLYVTAIEPSEAMLQKAQERLKGQNVKLILDRAQALPVESNSYDVVVMTYVLRHIKPEYLSIVATEIKRVTKSGAIVLLADLHLPLTGAFPSIGRDNPNYLILGILAVYDPASLGRYFEDYGFETKSLHYYPLSFVMRLDKT